jgi:hypothetical protein
MPSIQCLENWMSIGETLQKMKVLSREKPDSRTGLAHAEARKPLHAPAPLAGCERGLCDNFRAVERSEILSNKSLKIRRLFELPTPRTLGEFSQGLEISLMA